MAVVLIADDETYIRDVIRRAIKPLNHTILEASEGNETLEILRTMQVDILILDLVMPHKGGIETFMEIREKNEDLKIVVITGKIRIDNDAVQQLTDQFRIDASLSKPFEVEELIEVIERLS